MNLNLDKTEWICLAIVIIFSFICTAKMALFSMSGCILDPDVAIYLLSGLKYAGLDIYNVAYAEDLFYTPVISFLTSLIFRIGYVDKNAIILVTGFLAFMGYIGLYYLLKRRFDSLLSLTGVIIYGSLLLVIFNTAKGMVDIPAISISIWSLLFAMKAIDENPKYFFISLPLLVIAFFTRYTSGFILPLILVYYFMKRDIIREFDCLISNRKASWQKFKGYIHSKELKYIILSSLISLILGIIISKTLILDYGGALSFLGQSVNTFNGHAFTSNIDYVINKSYYFNRFTDMMFGSRDISPILACLAHGICALGLIIKAFKNRAIIKSYKRPFKIKHLNKLLIASSIILIGVSLFSFKVIANHMISNICVLISLTFIYSILAKSEIDNEILSIDFLFLAYFLINFIFASIYPIKVERYALPFVPPFIYFIILGLEGIVEDMHYDKLSMLKLDKTVPIVLILIFMFSTATFIAPIEYERSNDVIFSLNYYGFKGDLTDACDFIISNDSDYHNKSFASFNHHSRIIRWYLNTNVTAISEHDHNFTDFNNDTTYLILSEDKNLKNYHKIKNFGDFYIYYHN